MNSTAFSLKNYLVLHRGQTTKWCSAPRGHQVRGPLPSLRILSPARLFNPNVGFHILGFHISYFRFHILGFHSLGFHSLGFHSLGFHSLGFHSLGFHSLGFHSLTSPNDNAHHPGEEEKHFIIYL